MRTIIHIGHHKTGTTSLQSFLALNSQLLLGAGILSPWVESQGAVWAQMQGMGKTEIDPDLLPANIREPHNALAFRMLMDATKSNVPPYHPGLPHTNQMMIAIDNQVELLDPETVVFCSEVMSRFGIEAPEMIDRFDKVLGGSDFAVHLTLRRPDEQLIAWHAQRLRFGNKAAPLSDPEAGFAATDMNLDYVQIAKPWLERLSGATLTLRTYDETVAAGGSIADFVASHALSLPDGMIEVPRMNTGIPRALLGLVRAANHALPLPVAKLFVDDLIDLTGGLDLPGARDIEFFGPSARARLVELFSPAHDWLSQQVGRDAFFADIEDLGQLREIPEPEVTRLVLDQMGPELISELQGSDVRAFVSELVDSWTPTPLV